MATSSIPPGTTIEIETRPGAHLYRFYNEGTGLLQILDGGGRSHQLAPGAECDVGKGNGQSLEVRVVESRADGAAFSWELIAELPG